MSIRKKEFWNAKIIERLIEANFKSRGHKKLWQYFIEVLDSEAYKKRINTLRRKHKITRKNAPSLNIQYYSHPDIYKEVEKICNDFSLYFVDWQDYILDDLLYREIEKYADIAGNNLCRFIDIEDDLLNEYFTDDWENRLSDVMKDEVKNFPVGILISPYASQNDIVDYVKKMFPLVRAWQERYKKPEVKIGKVKRKRVKERDDFILQNSDKTGKEIARLVKEKFGASLPYEYIPKIISREKKKRQKL